MPEDIILLPIPRKIERLPGFNSKPASSPVENIDPVLVQPESYVLEVTPDRVFLFGSDDAGLFYGRQTLTQLRRQFPDSLPCLRIEDWPDFPARGVMLDISRDKVPTMATLYQLVEMLSEWKINQLQLYTEHTFAYSAHRDVWEHASPMTAGEIKALDKYCRDRFVELVPNQNSFGHMERWLKHEAYKHLAEAPDGFDFPWGEHFGGPFSLCPADPGSLNLVEGLYDELLPNFTSRLFNVGCDETFDLGQGRSKKECEARGTERVYLDFLLKIHKLVEKRGRTMMFWGDIIMHRPDLIPELPADVIALEWGYEADHPFDQDGARFAEAGIPFYVCPGTSTWNTISGRTDNCLANIRNAAENGLKHGAIGLLNTDWGDNGHLQYLPMSFLGFAAGAAYSWCLESNRTLPIADALSLHAFRDQTNRMGQIAYDLGNVYQKCGKLVQNASALFHLLIYPEPNREKYDGLTLAGLEIAFGALNHSTDGIRETHLDRPDGKLIQDEFLNAYDLLRMAHVIGETHFKPDPNKRRLLGGLLRGCINEHRRLWLLRNRLGGLDDSCARLESRVSELS